ncbi:YheC/YheD family protein [Microaerobacter geothermalis]|uniref:YheC/YheD family endospore coat-associated protein n=1 Tax=Microaerobacter geothermalis TaxID=674972 RepID=UPI001F3FE9C6|nr:YheC/YheD family protein [Microaerobacter geothermalis]MCF6094619.1 YheC/YheD family protein [Microaerobacter geothermalis]
MNPFYLGIMVCRVLTINQPTFGEKTFFKNLFLEGKKLGVPMYIFSPLDIDWPKEMVKGYYLSETGWKEKVFPLPRVVYDRCFYPNQQVFKMYQPYVKRVKSHPSIKFLGFGLMGKWEVYEILKTSQELSSWLPPSALYTNEKEMLKWLNQYQSIILKPISGSHGRGIIRLTTHTNNQYSLIGRTEKNEFFHCVMSDWRKTVQWINRFVNKRKYLVQPYLNLTNKDGNPFDVRILAQKNHKGEWTLTGMAVRCGQKGHLTSNLHGGGKAEEIEDFLNRNFPENIVKKILWSIQRMVELLPPYLESHHGRLIELGIDIGIEPNGQIWLLEVNSKPGRRVFQEIGNKEMQASSIRNPVKYARYLLERV